MFDLFGTNARTLREMGRNLAARHVETLQTYVIAHVLAKCPQKVSVPLGFVLSKHFVDEVGPEWRNRHFMKGYLAYLDGMCTHDAKLEKVKKPLANYMQARKRQVPVELMLIHLEFEQTKGVPAPLLLTEPEKATGEKVEYGPNVVSLLEHRRGR